METRSKRKYAEKNGLDYISRLPDDLLIHILSFLSVIDAFKTCLVAKRWSTLWTQVPDLDLDCAYFNSEDQFADCVTSVLKHRGTDQQLDVFQLTRDGTDSELEFYPPLLKWISRVVKFSPRGISISVCVDFEKFTLPKSLFTCKSLEQLVVVIEIPYSFVDLNTKAIKLPRLKYLKLSYVYINSKDMKNILRGCPMLEDLYFEFCDLNFSKVPSNKLNSLVVNNCDLNKKKTQFPSLVVYNSI